MFPSVLKGAVFGGSVPLACIGQAVVFGLGHVSPKASKEENSIVSGLQIVNGLWFGALYLMTGGDVVPCIVAHTVSQYFGLVFL